MLETAQHASCAAGALCFGTPAEAIGLLSERMSAFESLWQIYATVSIGFLGFIAAYREQIGARMGGLLALGYSSFAFGNWQGLTATVDQRWTIYRAAESAFGAQQAPWLRVFEPANRVWVSASHLAGDLGVVIIILVLTQPRLRAMLRIDASGAKTSGQAGTTCQPPSGVQNG